MLLGRGGQLQRIDALIARLASGSSGRLLLVGEPGIGKSSLLGVAARRARRRGVRVLHVRAVEGSADVPYAVLADLHDAAGGQAPAVAGTARAADALYAALLAARTAQPVLVLLDDAQNADRASLTAVDTALGRLVGSAVGCLVASRPDRDVERVLASWGRLDLPPLSSESSVGILRSVLGVGIDAGVAQSLAAALGGNPLALKESARMLTPDQLNGRAPLPDPLPIAPTLMRAWGAAVAALPEATQAAVLDLAVAGPRPALLGALAGNGTWSIADLDPAVEAGLVEAGAPPQFCHPLVRDVVLQGAPAAVLRARHAAAADGAAAAGLSPAVVVGFLARSVVVGDDAVAARVAGQAERAESLGHLDAACHAWAVAARLTTSPQDRLARALRGVRVAARFDLDVGVVADLLDLLDGVALDHEAQGWVAWLRSTMRSSVDPRAALTSQWTAIEAARDRAPAVIPVLLWDAAMSAWTVGDTALGLRAARETLAWQESAPAAGASQASGRTFPPWTGRALLASGLIQSGQVVDGLTLRDAVLAAAAATDPTAMDVGTLLDAVFLDDLLLDDSPAGARRLAVAEERLRLAPEPLACLWGIEAWRARSSGEWAAARELLARAVPLADAAGASGAARGMAALATELSAACDDAPTLQQAADRLRGLTERWGDRRRRVTHDRALGLRALLDGELDDALTWLLLAADVGFLGRGLRDGIVPARVDLVETYLRRGETELAGERASAVLAVLEQFQGPLARGLQCRVRALAALADDDQGSAEAAFNESLEHHRMSADGFERARTALLFGEQQRRVRQRARARPLLADAVAQFDRLGAVPWRERAATELRACGGSGIGVGAAAAGGDTGVGLTAQERAVAEAVAAGRSNREVADLLHLSARTVEHHLGSAYRKLGIRGRAGIATALRAAGE